MHHINLIEHENSMYAKIFHVGNVEVGTKILADLILVKESAKISPKY
jgi:hypothetical protein